MNKIDAVLKLWESGFEASKTSDREVPRRKSREAIIADASRPISDETCSNLKRVQPWNYDDFLQRTRTFKASTWFAKPELISPFQCARCGWVNKAANVVVCTSCDVEITHDPDDVDGSKFYQAMQTAHSKERCHWISSDGSDNFSPLDFLGFLPPSSAPADLVGDLCTRIGEWCKHISYLRPTVVPAELRQWQQAWNMLEGVMQPDNDSSAVSHSTTLREYLRNRMGLEEGSISTSNLSTVLLLSLFGWHPTTGEGCVSMHCQLCARSLVLETACDNGIDPFHQHRHFCPWVCVPIVSGEGYEMPAAGWVLTAEALLQQALGSQIAKDVMSSCPHYTSDVRTQRKNNPQCGNTSESFPVVCGEKRRAAADEKPCTEGQEKSPESVYKKIRSVLDLVRDK